LFRLPDQVNQKVLVLFNPEVFTQLMRVVGRIACFGLDSQERSFPLVNDSIKPSATMWCFKVNLTFNSESLALWEVPFQRIDNLFLKCIPYKLIFLQLC